MNLRNPGPVNRGKAFSLVEVAIALGLVTFAVVSVIGLLPVGLSTMRDAMTQTVSTQIVREISAELLLTPFQQINDYINQSPIFFDVQGKRASSADAYYKVQLSRSNSIFPGSGTSSSLTNSVCCVHIAIITHAYKEGAGTTNQQILHVANSGF